MERVHDILQPYLRLLARGGLSPLLQVRQSEIPLAALLAGYSAADFASALCPSVCPWALANLLGIKVEQRGWPTNAPAGLSVRSEYIPLPPTAIIYVGPLEKLADLVFYDHRELRKVDLPAVHLAHELFHHLAAHPPAQLEQRLRSLPGRYEETAAHAFTHGFLDLAFFPAELDLVWQRAHPSA
jgi:hypothetical protein